VTTYLDIVGIDTGGTFTDFILWREGELSVHKVLSTPTNPEQAILTGLKDLGVNLQQAKIIHGSTVATNAALENKGVKTLYVANKGFADVLTIGRQNRRELYNLTPDETTPPVPQELCIEVGSRLSAQGHVLEDISENDIAILQKAIEKHQPESIAINLLFSYLDNTAERKLAKCLPDSLFTSLSSDVLPEIKEYERGIATWLNSWLGPLVGHYLKQLVDSTEGASVSVMQSSGDTIEASEAAAQAVRMLLSGPAGGLVAANKIAKKNNIKKILTFDMGGTSTDVAMIESGIKLTSEGKIGHYPVAIPMVEMQTIGAGGGSLAWLDEGGMLQVGPESAGANPGPACYGQGGLQATVTDANVFLGRIPAEALLGGSMSIDYQAAVDVIEHLASEMGIEAIMAARGVVSIANEHMMRSLGEIATQRAQDVRDFTLFSFGGAGGLHVCALAEGLGITSAMVPAFGGVLSALGLLVSDPGRQYSQTLICLLSECDNATIESVFNDLKEKGRKALVLEGQDEKQIHYSASVDLRYQGQSFSLNLPWSNIEKIEKEFHVLHEQRYGHKMSFVVELVNIRLGVIGKGLGRDLDLSEKVIKVDSMMHGNVVSRLSMLTGKVIKGPLVITDDVATTWLEKDWQAFKDENNNLILTRE